MIVESRVTPNPRYVGSTPTSVASLMSHRISGIMFASEAKENGATPFGTAILTETLVRVQLWGFGSTS